MKKHKQIRQLCLAAMFVALNIVAARFLGWQTADGSIRVSPQYIVIGLSGWALGPIWACGAAIAGDLLGMMIFPAGKTLMPVITIAAAARGFIYGLILYKYAVSVVRNCAAVFATFIVCDLGLTTLGISQMTGNPFFTQLWMRLPSCLVMLVVSMAALTIVMKLLEKPLGEIFIES